VYGAGGHRGPAPPRGVVLVAPGGVAPGPGAGGAGRLGAEAARAQADAGRSPRPFLTVLLQDEVERRAQSKLRLRLRRAAFDPTKTLEGFDFSFNPKLNKAQVFDLATCQFIERHENALLYGPTGVGKSHLGQALAHEACRRAFDVLFIDTAKAALINNGIKS